jgi:tRNA nucleotidyltransferase/poly(A) polymerase
MNKFEKTLQFISQKIQPDSPYYGKIYLVGGCVRDELLGERYKDLDLLIDLPNGQREWVEYMCATYPETCHGPFYYQRYGTTAMDVIIDGSLTLVECVEPHIEVYAEDGLTLIETKFCTLEEDACRRDYTCNALYKNLHTGEVLDPTGSGITDLRAGLLRTPLDAEVIFRQDAVRMLRGVRFKHQKGFHFLPETWEAIVRHHDEMRGAAPKRVRDELNKILKCATLPEAIEDLYACGLLPYVMPGVETLVADTRLVADLKEPETLWQHTARMLHELAARYPHADTNVKLTLLVFHTMETGGRKQAETLLKNAQIGKEKMASVLHNVEMLLRYRSFYAGGRYVARPRALPHFLTALGKGMDAFRQMVRMINVDRLEAEQLPCDCLYSGDRKGGRSSERSNGRGGERGRRSSAPREAVERPLKSVSAAKAEASASGPSETPATASPRKHKRNVQRRLQRKRAKARKKAASE